MDGLPWRTFVFFLPVLGLIALQLWAVVDGITIPSVRWRKIGRPKVISLLVIWFSSPIGPVYYLLRLRPRLRHDHSLGPSTDS